MATFGDIVGQEQIREHLRNAVLTGKISQSYIINGFDIYLHCIMFR